MRFQVGDKVEKIGGEYKFAGEVRSAFTKIDGAERYVVENQDGVLHIFNDRVLALGIAR